MGGNFVVAGGSKGIGLEVVNQLIPSADRIDVFSRSQGELAGHEKVFRHDMDFTENDLDFSAIPDVVNGVVGLALSGVDGNPGGQDNIVMAAARA